MQILQLKQTQILQPKQILNLTLLHNNKIINHLQKIMIKKMIQMLEQEPVVEEKDLLCSEHENEKIKIVCLGYKYSG